MHRRIAEMPIEAAHVAAIKQKMLNWSSRFSISLFLDSNSYGDKYGRYECLMGAGAAAMIFCDDAHAFELLQNSWNARRDWFFGHFCYDLKNVLQPHLSSRHEHRHGFRPLQFFVPEAVCFIPRGQNLLRVESLVGDPFEIATEIMNIASPGWEKPAAINFHSRLAKEAYLEKIATLREHILEGDCYEITFCNEAFAEQVTINPRAVFTALNHAAAAPFAAFYQDGERAMMCTSPERFLQKEGNDIRSQPIKGTSRRSSDPEEDERLKTLLYNSEKERAENVMITDLVRNDLARSCEPGSVKVDELFGIYSFPNVHQMISTISGKLREQISFTEAIKMAFPMGSMTGAPKHKVMQLIDRYELSRRELFSGSVGYLSPGGDFDFNVIIRSLFYNADTQYLSFQTGGAITWGSNAEEEWDEMRLKAAAMEKVFRAP